MAEPPILDVAGLSVSYRTQRGALRALQDVSFTVPRGEVLGIVGESGSGKSTAILALLGLLGPGADVHAERAAFDGADLLSNAASLRGRRIGMVFQDPSSALNPALTIGLQVAEPMLVHRRLPQAEAFARATDLLAEMGIPRPAQIMRAYPHQLSGGMKQRVVIASALAGEPDLLLLDEPTTALDVTVEAQILDLLEELRVRRGLSMILVSHNLGIVDRTCARLTVLYAGRTVETGPAADVLAAPLHPYTSGLLDALPRPDRAHAGRLVPIPGGLPDMTAPVPGCNFAPRCAFVAAGCDAAQILALERPHRSVRCHRAAEIAGRPWPAPAPPAARAMAYSGGPLVDGHDLARAFAGMRAVDGMSISVQPGEILGLVGESGCGKSTLGRLLLRLIGTDSGTLDFAGARVPDQPDGTFRRRAQIVFQNPDTSLNPRHSIEKILLRPLQVFGLARGAAAAREIDRLLDNVRLPRAYRTRYPHQLSGGEKQRVGIARALASRPDFLVCDEAVSALDVSVQAAILNLICDLRDEFGMAYLFISHDIGVIGHVADRVAVMYRGRLMEEGPVTDVLRPPYHPYTEALLSAVPVVGAKGRIARRVRLQGDPAAPVSAEGCRFASRCPRHLGPICDTQAPPWREAEGGHRIACHIPLPDLAAVPALLF